MPVRQCLPLLFLLVAMASAVNKTNSVRQGKVFSLFNIVQFKNDPCQSTSSIAGGGTTSQFRNGTCYTGNECNDKGGTSSGSCAAGFGVCCVFTTSTCGSTVNQNCTYVRNPGFPSTYTSATSCTFQVNKCSNTVCQLRLDFETFNIDGPTGSVETNGGTCANDVFAVTSLNTGTAVVPNICGINTGQHMYVDIGASNSDTATFSFSFPGGSTTTNRQWEIKVTQIPCSSRSKAPVGCLQYHVGCQGTLQTFNFADTTSSHLANQCYNICIRQEEGMCCIKYSPCSDANSFSLDSIDAAAMSEAHVETSCALDFVEITGGSQDCCNTVLTNRYCGQFLSSFDGSMASEPVCDCSTPFQVGIITDTLQDAMSTAVPNRGVCLNYEQIPCGQSI